MTPTLYLGFGKLYSLEERLFYGENMKLISTLYLGFALEGRLIYGENM